MQSLIMALGGWFVLSLLFGMLWTSSALVLKEARRRWPQMAVDPAWQVTPHAVERPADPQRGGLIERRVDPAAG